VKKKKMMMERSRTGGEMDSEVWDEPGGGDKRALSGVE
jgi:hypothetical protein